MMKLRATVGMLAVSALAAVAMAETTATSGKMLRMKPGESVFTILDTKGVRPMPGSELSVRDMKDGEAVVTAVANEAGRAVIELTEGRFILSVDKLNLSVLDVSPDAAHTECRIVMPSQDMLVGGQETEDDDEAVVAPVTLGSKLMTPVVIGGALVLVGGVAYAIDEHGSDSKSATVVVEDTTPRTVTRTRTQTVVVPVPPVPSP